MTLFISFNDMCVYHLIVSNICVTPILLRVIIKLYSDKNLTFLAFIFELKKLKINIKHVTTFKNHNWWSCQPLGVVLSLRVIIRPTADWS